MTTFSPLGPRLIPRLCAGLYAVIIACRNLWYDLFPGAVRKLNRYTISIGGIHAGGTGKTPLTLLLGEYFQKNKRDTVILSRGYKRKTTKPIIVPPGEQRSWEEIGDEPALLKRNLPDTWLGIGADRFSTGTAIQARISDNGIMILDDGFQHRRLFRDRNIVCLPPDPFHDYLLPAGYLRDPYASLNRADIICLIGLEKETDILIRNQKKTAMRFPKASVFILLQTVDQWINTKTGEITQASPLHSPIVISGIARPYRFLDLISQCGITPCRIINYEDHHAFQSSEIEKLCAAETDGILTTEKDIVRLSTINLVNCLNICYLKIKLKFLNRGSEEKFFRSIEYS